MMNEEMKGIMTSLLNSVLSNIADKLKGENTDTIETIKERNLNISLLKIRALMNNKKNSICIKMMNKGVPSKALLSVLNEEL